MLPDQPLLTIAVPTYNRSATLDQLLQSLAPQLQDESRIELLISDNASPDDTPQLIEEFEQCGHVVQYVRNTINIGPDGNFAQCFELARGRFFLLLSDDDLLVPGALAKILHLLEAYDPDIVYLSSYPFSEDALAERKEDSLGRTYHVMEDPLQFARTANLMLTFISGVIVNRDRFAEIKHEAVTEFTDTMLIQLSWTLPFLRDHRRSICVWERLLAGRINNSGGYNIAKVFGVNLKHLAERLLPDQPVIAQSFSNAALRRWFPGTIFDLRAKQAPKSEIDGIWQLLKQEHRTNWRLFVFVLPVTVAPLPLAKIWVSLTRAVNKLIYVVHFPGFRRVS
jgi:abequosyltransferase